MTPVTALRENYVVQRQTLWEAVDGITVTIIDVCCDCDRCVDVYMLQ